MPVLFMTSRILAAGHKMTARTVVLSRLSNTIFNTEIRPKFESKTAVCLYFSSFSFLYVHFCRYGSSCFFTSGSL